MDGKLIGQMDPEEARAHGLAMFEAAEAAEQDAFLYAWTMKTVGVGPVQAAGMLQEFRRWREARGKKGPPGDAAEFIHPDNPVNLQR